MFHQHQYGSASTGGTRPSFTIDWSSSLTFLIGWTWLCVSLSLIGFGAKKLARTCHVSRNNWPHLLQLTVKRVFSQRFLEGRFVEVKGLYVLPHSRFLDTLLLSYWVCKGHRRTSAYCLAPDGPAWQWFGFFHEVARGRPRRSGWWQNALHIYVAHRHDNVAAPLTDCPSL